MRLPLRSLAANQLAARYRNQQALQLRVRFGGLPERGEVLGVREQVVGDEQAAGPQQAGERVSPSDRLRLW